MDPEVEGRTSDLRRRCSINFRQASLPLRSLVSLLLFFFIGKIPIFTVIVIFFFFISVLIS